jgi:selT/selW/selH-like putative selenoprotein
VGVRLKGGRRGSFEVTLDDEVLHSKLATGEWSDEERILETIATRLAR